MEARYKIAIGISLAALVVWAFTTKNEVVESAVFPVKVKLGLAGHNTDKLTVKNVESVKIGV